jgi:hypothetical protein
MADNPQGRFIYRADSYTEAMTTPPAVGRQTTLGINFYIINEPMKKACLVEARRSRYLYGLPAEVPSARRQAQRLSSQSSERCYIEVFIS